MRFRLVLAIVLGASVAAAAPEGWTKVDEKNGIAVYRREVAGSDVIAFRGEGDVAAPMVRVASVIFDTARAAEWIEDLTEAHVVRKISDLEYIEYDHFAAPPLVKDRDFVTSNRLTYDPVKRAVTIEIHSVVDPAAPPTSHVRGNLVRSTFVLTPTADGKGTHVSGDVHCDPAGSLPKFLVNFFQKDWPRSTFERLRRQVAKTDIVDHPAIAKLVAP